MINPLQKVSQQTEINHPENIDLEFSEGQADHNTETNSPYKEDIIDQEYSRPAEKHSKDSPELRRWVNTSKVVCKFLPKQKDLNKILKLIERKMLKGTHLPM